MKTFIITSSLISAEITKNYLNSVGLKDVVVWASINAAHAGSLASSLLAKGSGSVALLIDTGTTNFDECRRIMNEYTALLGSNLANEIIEFEVFIDVPSVKEAVEHHKDDISIVFKDVVEFIKKAQAL